jgi:hypothetical protein
MTDGSLMLLWIKIGWVSIELGLAFADGFCLFILGWGSVGYGLKSDDHSSCVPFTTCVFSCLFDEL